MEGRAGIVFPSGLSFGSFPLSGCQVNSRGHVDDVSEMPLLQDVYVLLCRCRRLPRAGVCCEPMPLEHAVKDSGVIRGDQVQPNRALDGSLSFYLSGGLGI